VKHATTTNNRAPIHTFELCRPTVRVPLASGKGPAVLDTADYEDLAAKGISLNWSLNSDGRGNAYVKTHIGGNVRAIARLITRAQAGEQVHYWDRNPLNLRGDNLYITRGGQATVDAAALLAQAEEATA